MVHNGIYATSAECISKMGDNYPSTVCTETAINEFCLHAEALINCQARDNKGVAFAVDKTAFDALPAAGRMLLAGIASDIVAIYGLTMKPSGEDGVMVRIEFEDRINILRDAALRGLRMLKDKKVADFIMGV